MSYTMPFQSNDQFNSWVVLEEVKIPKQSHRHYRCQCKCGTISVLNSQSIKESNSTKCRDCAFKTHGMTATKTYKIWVGMLSRCYNKKVRVYKYYGGRGIEVCDRWKAFENFYADMGERPKGLQLDRINNDGNYEPSNCRWVTSKENNPYNKGTIPDDMPGKRYGKWLVIERVEHKKGHRYYLCQCDCGDRHIRPGGELRRKRTTKCRQCKNKEHGKIHKGWSDRKKRFLS